MITFSVFFSVFFSIFLSLFDKFRFLYGSYVPTWNESFWIAKKGKYILNHETTEKDIEQSTIAPVAVSIGKYTRTVSKKSSSGKFRFLYGSYVPTRNESSGIAKKEKNF